MEQRSLRLGDVVDDYCPRERRVTNHVIVVLEADAIRQTRCNTCDAEHDYKEAKVPRRKKNGEASDLAGGVLITAKPANGNGAATDVPAVPVAAQAAVPVAAAEPPAPVAAQSEDDAKTEEGTMPDGWLAHRPLIRATLPRTENEIPQPRAIPEFTMHQRQGRGFGGRGGGFRHGSPGHNGGRMPPFRDGNGGGEPDGNRPQAPGGGGGGKGRHRRRRRR